MWVWWFVVTNAINSSDNITIDPGNYTTTDTGSILISTGGASDRWNGTIWEVSYTFNYGEEDCEAVEDIIGDFTDFIPWIGIILLVIAAAIILGIVIKSFAGGKV